MTGHWSRLDRHVRSVAAEDACFGLRPDVGAKSDRTLAGCIRSVLTYADVRRTEKTLSDRTPGGSSRAGQDASDREISRLEPYWKRPDAEI